LTTTWKRQSGVSVHANQTLTLRTIRIST